MINILNCYLLSELPCILHHKALTQLSKFSDCLKENTLLFDSLQKVLPVTLKQFCDPVFQTICPSESVVISKAIQILRN